MSRTLLYAPKYRWNHDYEGAHFFAQLDAFHSRRPITHLIYGSGPVALWANSWAAEHGIPHSFIERRADEHLDNYIRRLIGLSQAERILLFPAERLVREFIRLASSGRYQLPIHYAEPLRAKPRQRKTPLKQRLTPRKEPRPLRLRADRRRWGQTNTHWNKEVHPDL